MYIIAIGWLWVTLMMAITESNLVAGILTFVFYGLLPCLLLLWLLSTSARRSWRAQIERGEEMQAAEEIQAQEQAATEQRSGDQPRNPG